MTTTRRSLAAALCAVLAIFQILSVSSRAEQAPPAQASAPTAATPPPSDETIAKECDALVRAWGDLGWFTGAVLVAKGDRVLYRGAAGYANPEFNALNTPDTSFRLVTISQMFTAAAVLRLQDMGKLNVQDAVGKYMTSWPDGYKPITIDQLLAGTSGVKDVTAMPEFVKSIAVPKSPKDIVETILKEPLVGPPGTVGRPMNSNYHLLSAIVAQVSGEPFADFVAREVIARAGLQHTRRDAQSEVVPGRADGLGRNGPVFTHAGWFHMDNAIGMADLIGTVDDVHRFVRALVGGRVISPASLAAMTTDHLPPAAPAPAASAPAPPQPSFGPLPTGYGLTMPAVTPRQWTTTGFINGFTASLTYLPDSETTVVVLSNVNGASEPGVIVRAILGSVLAGKPAYHPARRPAVTPRAEDLAAVAGTWDVAGTVVVAGGTRAPLRLTARVDGTRLFVKFSTASELEWKSDGPGSFFSPNSDQRIVLLLDKPGQIELQSFGGHSALTKSS